MPLPDRSPTCRSVHTHAEPDAEGHANAKADRDAVGNCAECHAERNANGNPNNTKARWLLALLLGMPLARFLLHLAAPCLERIIPRSISDRPTSVEHL